VSAVAILEITGLAAIRERLTPERVRQVILGALRDGMRPVAQAASALAPHRTGTLASKVHAVISDRRGAVSAAIVGGTGYGHLVEFGHRIASGGRLLPRGFTSLSRRARYRGTVAGVVPPHPFARPAWEAQRDRVTRLIEERLAALVTG
jgi:HK97 gp10 family phage protein